jgi:hypothetical protein
MAYTGEVNRHDGFKGGSPIIDNSRYDWLKRYLHSTSEDKFVDIETIRGIFAPIVSPFGLPVRSECDQFEDWLKSEGLVFANTGYSYQTKYHIK